MLNFNLKKKKKDETEEAACTSCPSCSSFLSQMGLDLSKWDYMIALAGNPNTGKSTVFNALTGLRQHTGNWPGKTITRAEGAFRYEDKLFKLVDLPGTYSLLSTSQDEEIARDFILFGQPNCTLAVVDATCLERNLNLVLQILEITDKVVVVLNLMDEAERKGIKIDHRALSRDLGVPVVPTIAKTGEGLKEVLRSITDVINGDILTKPHRIQIEGGLRNAVGEVVPLIQKIYPNTTNPQWIALRLLDGDQSMRNAFLNGDLDNLIEAHLQNKETADKI